MKNIINNKTFHNVICILQTYWLKNGCTIIQPLDLPVGAGTFHNKTFFGSIGTEHFSFAYVQPSRRPTDGRYGENPNRLQHYYQFQVAIKPAPNNIQEMYLDSLNTLQIDSKIHDIRFVEDNWENPTLGASGIGWEIWLNGMEISQFTYFQKVGGIECNPITVEITYGLERINMHIQNKKNVYEILWNDKPKTLTYGDLFFKNEKEQSLYNFKYATLDLLYQLFEQYSKESLKLIEKDPVLIFPSYENILQAIHIFNILDARKALSITERKKYILHIRKITNAIAKMYYNLNK
ncbi:glycine--tRNA ligase subunit alpha [Buchnera aphidicola (Pemphigus obesinymphae)]|uniref:glycine--tRNA ligase subunit alpha n=1 Tax=Buchnera aphidicola TaxID=9 RepID=UPI002237B9A7|nr:glycine--tRNA ligase subunit alpha [Buchnera aphidicola]MCW5196585.1 glycine--tRNA ligase subunit alpha [Buchnera aphidicola (Pemphigus obesinymphae)]